MKISRLLTRLPSLLSSHTSFPNVSQTIRFSSSATTTTADRSFNSERRNTNEITLYSRISPVANPNVSIKPVLDQWVKEGHDVNHGSLRFIVEVLRHHRRYKHALQISEWMTKRDMQVTAADIAIRLDLIAKVHGVEEAEKYFNNISKELKTLEVHVALLKCYAHAQCVDKAEDIMQKIRDLGFAADSDPMTYNILLSMYCRTGNREKSDALICEMKEKQIKFESSTYNILLNMYGAASDIDGVEKLMRTMESDSELKLSWMTYAVAAKYYVKAGLVDKALEALKKSEKLIGFANERNKGFNVILKIYAAAGKTDEVLNLMSHDPESVVPKVHPGRSTSTSNRGRSTSTSNRGRSQHRSKEVLMWSKLRAKFWKLKKVKKVNRRRRRRTNF